MTSRSCCSNDPTYKVELREGLGYRRDVLEDRTNILCRNTGGRLVIDAKQHNGKTKTLIWDYAFRTTVPNGRVMALTCMTEDMGMLHSFSCSSNRVCRT